MRSGGSTWRWTAVLGALFAVWSLYEHRWNWTAGTDRRLATGLVLFATVQALLPAVRRERPGDAATRALTGGAILGVVHCVVWLTPCPIQDAFCSAPATYCEHGVLAYALPMLAALVAIGAAMIAALSAWGVHALVPRRRV